MRYCYIYLFFLLIFPHATAPPSTEGTVVLSKPEEFKEAFATVPCKDKDRLPAVKNLFLKMGATESDITVEKLKGVENIFVRKQGETNEKIVIGAHYDFKGIGSCGAVDNWTGIVAIAHIYKSLKDVKLKKTLLFVGFGKEEQGLLGSNVIVKQTKDEEMSNYCAMVNIDSLGLNTPQVARNISSSKLEAAAKELAEKMKIPYQAFEIGGVSDSLPFLKRNIPALTISALNSNWQDILHHAADQAVKVEPFSVYLGYRLALALVDKISNSDCGAYR